MGHAGDVQRPFKTSNENFLDIFRIVELGILKLHPTLMESGSPGLDSSLKEFSLN